MVSPTVWCEEEVASDQQRWERQEWARSENKEGRKKRPLHQNIALLGALRKGGTTLGRCRTNGTQNAPFGPRLRAVRIGRTVPAESLPECVRELTGRAGPTSHSSHRIGAGSTRKAKVATVERGSAIRASRTQGHSIGVITVGAGDTQAAMSRPSAVSSICAQSQDPIRTGALHGARRACCPIQILIGLAGGPNAVHAAPTRNACPACSGPTKGKQIPSAGIPA